MVINFIQQGVLGHALQLGMPRGRQLLQPAPSHQSPSHRVVVSVNGKDPPVAVGVDHTSSVDIAHLTLLGIRRQGRSGHRAPGRRIGDTGAGQQAANALGTVVIAAAASQGAGATTQRSEGRGKVASERSVGIVAGEWLLHGALLAQLDQLRVKVVDERLDLRDGIVVAVAVPGESRRRGALCRHTANCCSCSPPSTPSMNPSPCPFFQCPSPGGVLVPAI